MQKRDYCRTERPFFPFQVQPAPETRPFAGFAVSIVGRFLTGLGLWGGAAILGVMGMPMVFLLFSLGVVHETSPDYRPFQPGELVLFVAFFLFTGVLGVLVFPYGKKCLELGGRLRARDALAVLGKDHRKPVLLLRSFEDEDIEDLTLSGQWFKRRRFEEGLTRALKRVGPPICVGRPNETASPLGAARLYVGNDDWKRAVLHLFSVSAVVVIVVGRTEGVWWEVDSAMRHVDRRRLLFFFPYVRPVQRHVSKWQRYLSLFFPLFAMRITRRLFQAMNGEREERYQLFRERIVSHVSAPLPAQLHDAQFLHFATDGAPCLLRLRRPLYSAIVYWFAKRPVRMHIQISRTLQPFVSKLEQIEHSAIG